MPVDITIEQVPKITENDENTSNFMIATSTNVASNTNTTTAREISSTTTTGSSVTTYMDKCRCIERMTGYFVANPDDFCSSGNVSPKGKL